MAPDGMLPDKAGRERFDYLVNGGGHHTADRKPSGRDLLRGAGFNPTTDFILVQLHRPGSHSVGQDETVDLKDIGAEEFRAFASDRAYAFFIDEVAYEWGADKVDFADLRDVSGAGPDKAFLLERTGEPDVEIAKGGTLDLSGRGTEKLRIVQAEVTIIVNAEPVRVRAHTLTYDEVVKLAFTTPPTGPNIKITVDYGNGPAGNAKGSMKPGEVVKIQNGMTFDVTATDRS